MQSGDRGGQEGIVGGEGREGRERGLRSGHWARGRRHWSMKKSAVSSGKPRLQSHSTTVIAWTMNPSPSDPHKAAVPLRPIRCLYWFVERVFGYVLIGSANQLRPLFSTRPRPARLTAAGHNKRLLADELLTNSKWTRSAIHRRTWALTWANPKALVAS